MLWTNNSVYQIIVQMEDDRWDQQCTTFTFMSCHTCMVGIIQMVGDIIYTQCYYYVTNRGLAWIYRLPPDKGFEPVYPTIKMASCSPFNKCCYQPTVITMILLWMRRTIVLGLWSYFFGMHLSSSPYLLYHTSHAIGLCICLFKWNRQVSFHHPIKLIHIFPRLYVNNLKDHS